MKTVKSGGQVISAEALQLSPVIRKRSYELLLSISGGNKTQINLRDFFTVLKYSVFGVIHIFYCNLN